MQFIGTLHRKIFASTRNECTVICTNSLHNFVYVERKKNDDDGDGDNEICEYKTISSQTYKRRQMSMNYGKTNS